jgi:hypothetical protein
MASFGTTGTIANLAIIAALTLTLGACGGGMSLPSFGSSSSAPAPEPGVGPEVPATIRADELVGKWGLASYQNPADRARTEKQAQAQCKQPYVISAGGSGGVVMHLADQATPQELRVKGRAARTISARPARRPASRTARSFPSTAACWSPASSTRMRRPATATWSMSAAGRGRRGHIVIARSVSDEAIQTVSAERFWIASLRSQ